MRGEEILSGAQRIHGNYCANIKLTKLDNFFFRSSITTRTSKTS